MLSITEKELEMMLQVEYLKGVKDGLNKKQQEIRQAYDNGKPLELDGRCIFLRSDIQNLRDIMDDMESECE